MDKLHKRVRNEENNLYGRYEDHSLQDVERTPFTNITNVSSSSSQIRYLKKSSVVAPLKKNRFDGGQSSSMQGFDTTHLSNNAKGHLVSGRYTLKNHKLITHSRKRHDSVQQAGVVPVDLHAVSFEGFECNNVADDINCTLNSMDSYMRTNSENDCAYDNICNMSDKICSTNFEDYDIPSNTDDLHSVHTINDTQCQNNYEESDLPLCSDDSDDIHFVDTINDTQCHDNFEDSGIPSNSDVSSVDIIDITDTAVSGIQDSEYLNIGEPTYICQKCGAMMWYEERTKKHYNARVPEFTMCCLKGKVVIAPYRRLPQHLHDLYQKHDKLGKFFLENIRSFNSMFAFTSMGGKVDNAMNSGRSPPMFVMNGENYHQIGSLLPMPGNQPKFAQLYIYDTDNEIANRMAAVRMDDENFESKSYIIQTLRSTLDDCNPYVQTYRTIRDTIMRQSGNLDIRLRILGKRGRDGRRYNLPAASEVAALIVGDFDVADFERDVVVETQSGLLQRVSVFEPAYLPLQYPLLFPRGEDGFRKDIPYNEERDPDSSKREFVTQKEWVAYRIQQRTRNQSTIVFAKRLFQQFLVDSFSTIESARLQYLRLHQKQLRASMYKGLTEAVLRGETDPTTSGKRIVLPSTFVGGARYMIQNYQDAMAICGWAGYPNLFITFTCNHKWPELVDFLKRYNLKSEDRPDLVTRIFKIKLNQLINDIKKGDVFGKVKSVIYTIEFQKRGLPHAHILVFLQPRFRDIQGRYIDKIISAEIPDKEKEPRLFDIVSSLMIHGPCGPQNINSPCINNGKCTKHFPKRFVDQTIIDADGYPVYRRRDNGVYIEKGKSFVDNRYVVPYNKHLLLKYNAHINVEWCNQTRSIKYLFKYVNKGHDRVTVTFYSGGDRRNDSDCIDEIKLYYDCRYLSACEAAWRIFSFDIHYREPSVERLSFHLENEQSVIYSDNDDLEEVVNNPIIQSTKFLAWLDANRRYPEARNLTYSQFPGKFVWKAKKHYWSPRKRGYSVGRIHFVPPGSGELFYLRTLLNYVKGPTSFEEIKSVGGIVKNTFKEACYARGLLEDDKEFVDAIVEASLWGTGTFLRHLFVTLLVSKQISRPDIVWNNTWECLSEDILHRQRRILQFPDLVLTTDQLKTYTLAEIEICLQCHGSSLDDYSEMPAPDRTLAPEINNRLIHDELNYNVDILAEEHRKLMSTMTSEQRRVYDTIMKRVDDKKPGLFFLYGYGGTGKTYIWRSLAAANRSRGEIVIAVASSGIAALLIPGGRTAHSRFNIPLTIHEASSCTITPDSDLATLIARAKLIIWDEAPMLHKHCFEAVDRAFRDVLRSYNDGRLDIPFGGKVVVLGGDFRQILPVIPKGTRQEVVRGTINSSYLWDFCEVLTLTTNMRLLSGDNGSDIAEIRAFSEWVLGIGDGSIGESNDLDISLHVPHDLLIPSCGDPLAAIVTHTYPDLLHNIIDPSFFKDRAILAPTNAIVDAINDYVLDLIPGEENTYLSCDSTCNDRANVGGPGDLHTPEFLNTITASGLPAHKLRLKVGVPVMLLRNIDQNLGLCNGTRLIITRMGTYVLEAKVISGSNINQKVFIPRLSLTPSDKKIPFNFQRRQFPLALSFAMTINKSQGQSLNQVGLYLPRSVFSHGQLYVAMSRVTSRKGLKILLLDEDGDDTDVTSNVVYKEVFQNVR